MAPNQNQGPRRLVGGILGAAAAPTAVIAGVQYVGFTTAGIAAKTVAAGMMSAAAKAAGGRIAAGSVVAVFQSIGAVGSLTAAPALAVAVAGAVIGVGVLEAASAVCSWLGSNKALARTEPVLHSASWKVAVEEEGGVLVYGFNSEEEARTAFKDQPLCYIMYHPNGHVVFFSGSNYTVLKAIHECITEGRMHEERKTGPHA